MRSNSDVQVKFRLSKDDHRLLIKAAKENSRSVSSEIKSRVTKSVIGSGLTPYEIAKTFSAMVSEVEALRSELASYYEAARIERKKKLRLVA